MLFYSFLLLYVVSSLLSFQVCIAYQNGSVEFLRLEELKEPTVHSPKGEVGMPWSYEGRRAQNSFSAASGGGGGGGGGMEEKNKEED